MRHDRIILGTLSLDMFAVFLGGATALLPIFARDILLTGPWGLGLLRSAPAIGALTMSIILARRPLTLPVGRVLFSVLTIYGLAVTCFAFSTVLWLSMAALALMGAADVVSVVIRFSLVQLRTPPQMRGRVSAVNGLFTGTSNQLGDFRAGVMGALFGAVPAVAIGGLGTIADHGDLDVSFPRVAAYPFAGRGSRGRSRPRGRNGNRMTEAEIEAPAAPKPGRACRPSTSAPTRTACASTGSSRRATPACRSAISSASSARARCG